MMAVERRERRSPCVGEWEAVVDEVVEAGEERMVDITGARSGAPTLQWEAVLLLPLLLIPDVEGDDCSSTER